MDYEKKIDELSNMLIKGKIKTFKKIEKNKQNSLYDEYAEYWASPEDDINDDTSEGEYAKLSFNDFCNLFRFEDKLNILEKYIEYNEYVIKMTKDPWNYWSPIDPETRGDIAGIAPGGYLIRKM